MRLQSKKVRSGIYPQCPVQIAAEWEHFEIGFDYYLLKSRVEHRPFLQGAYHSEGFMFEQICLGMIRGKSLWHSF